MRNAIFTTFSSICLALVICCGQANGDMVVNIDGDVNGSPGVFGDGADIEVFLTAGNYTITLVNNVFGHASYHPEANFTAWTFHHPGSNWGTNYNFNYDDGDAGNNSRPVPPYAGPDELNGGRFSSAIDAITAFEDAATNGQLSFDVFIPFDQTVGFYIADNSLSDNLGGISVMITQNAIPEPAGPFAMLFVAASLLIRRRATA